MSSFFNHLGYFDFLHPLLGWLALISFFTFCLSLIFIPWLVGRIPQDYFVRSYKIQKVKKTISPGSVTVAAIRNGFGIVLILAGIAMLFLPGQGILTILLGFLLLSFPGKEKVITRLFANTKVQKSMDWLRLKRGKEQFTWPKES